MPSCLLSNRRWGTREERRVVGVAHILGKRYLRFPLLFFFGKRCWQLERTRGNDLCTQGYLGSVSLVSVAFVRAGSWTVKPGIPLRQSLSEVLTEPGVSENWRAWAAGGLSEGAAVPGESKASEPSVT